MAKFRMLTAALAGAIVLGGASSAFAVRDSDRTHVYQAWMDSDLTTTEAANIAEQAAGGEIAYLSFHHDDYGNTVYFAETESPGVISRVTIDANTGAVLNLTSVTDHQASRGGETMGQVPQPGPANPGM